MLYLLWCAVMYYAVLCCAVLCCAVLCCAVLRCAVLYCTVLCCAVLYCAVLWCDVLWCYLQILYEFLVPVTINIFWLQFFLFSSLPMPGDIWSSRIFLYRFGQMYLRLKQQIQRKKNNLEVSGFLILFGGEFIFLPIVSFMKWYCIHTHWNYWSTNSCCS